MNAVEFDPTSPFQSFEDIAREVRVPMQEPLELVVEMKDGTEIKETVGSGKITGLGDPTVIAGQIASAAYRIHRYLYG